MDLKMWDSFKGEMEKDAGKAKAAKTVGGYVKGFLKDLSWRDARNLKAKGAKIPAIGMIGPGKKVNKAQKSLNTKYVNAIARSAKATGATAGVAAGGTGLAAALRSKKSKKENEA